MTVRRNPCYNCGSRTALCRLDCTAWAQYVKRRDEKYNDPKRKAETDYSGAVVDRMERCRKRIRRKNRRMQ